MPSVFVFLILAALALMQLLIGGGDGTRLIYVLPSYLVVGLAGVLTVFRLPRATGGMDRGCLLTVLGLSAYLVTRMALSPVESLAWVDFFTLLGSLLVYFITALFVRETGHRMAMVIVLLVMGLGHVAVGIFQFAKDSNFSPLLASGRGDPSQRASGLYISPNHFAGFLEVVFLFGVSLFFWGGMRALAKTAIAYLTLAALAGVVVSGSRGGYLSTAAGLAVFTVLSVWTARSALSPQIVPRLVGIIAAVAILAGILTVVTAQNFSLRARASTVFVSEDIRLSLWEAAWKQFKLAPIFGTGSRTYLYYGRMFRAPGVLNDPAFVHNDYLQTLAEYGVAGLVLILGFVAMHLRHAWVRWREMTVHFADAPPFSSERNDLALLLGSIAAITAYLLHSVTDFNLHIPANALLVAFAFGLLATRAPQPGTGVGGWRVRWPLALPAVLGLWMLAVCAPKFRGEICVETARARLAEGNFAGGLDEAERAFKLGIRSPDLFYYIGEGRRLMSREIHSPEERASAIEAAHRAYAEGLALFPQDTRLLLITAWTLDRLDRFEEAEKLYAQAIRLDPNNGTVWAYYAWHNQFGGKPVEALENYNKAARNCDVAAVLKLVGERLDPRELEAHAAAARVGK